MTATERLRALLDERGVEHTDAEDGHTQHTWWSDGDHEIGASNSGERLAVYNLTPEQAIAATLGPGTCHFKTVELFIDHRRSRADICECDRCGYRCARGFIVDERFKCCPNCGARIEVDE